MISRNVTALLCFALVAKLFHVRADVDGLACRLHRPTNYG
jgi:hypothetical protein